ncbi:MAG: hypothetical protein Rubg2KO_19600 [Rubricoccaceae bacterium]
MRQIRFPAFSLLAALALLSACAAPSTDVDTPTTSTADYVPDTPAEYGPGDYCAETYVIVTDNPRTNFSLGSENYKNNDYCAAYPYLKWLLATDPLFTGEDPDDRNFLRMAGVYEQFAQQADSSERRVWLDSSLAIRQEGREAMDAAGVEYEPYLRDLVEGFFYYSNAAYYEDASEKQYAAFNRALDAKPDSLEDWYLGQLFIGSAEQFPGGAPNTERAEYVERLAYYADETPTQQYYTSYATYLKTPPPEGTLVGVDDSAVIDIITAFNDGSATEQQKLQLLGLVLQDEARVDSAGGNPDALRRALLTDPVVTNNVDNPRTLLALSFQAFTDGNSTEGENLFNRALTNAPSNAARADYLYARSAKGHGGGGCSQALRYSPTHAPCRYSNLNALGRQVGTQRSLTGRFNYWCLADRYRQLAASSTDSRIASAARRAAGQYERSGPTREQYFFEGYKPGQTVSCSVTGGSTRVR